MSLLRVVHTPGVAYLRSWVERFVHDGETDKLIALRYGTEQLTERLKDACLREHVVMACL